MPLLEQYGDQLVIAGIDITQKTGSELFGVALQYFSIEKTGVPFLVIGDTYLVGSVEIPQKFPQLIEEYLAMGGIEWPTIPGLMALITASEASQGEQTPVTPTVNTPAEAQPTPITGLESASDGHSRLGAGFSSDPLGNSLAVVVLAGMIVSVFGAALTWQAEPSTSRGNRRASLTWRWLIPLLCLVGIGVAGYLTYVETAQVEAVCGPVGDCNTVQQSEYARLFGFLPIGVLGIGGYILILLAWIGAAFGQGKLAAYTRLALLGLAAIGVVFSIYLTFLEPFVIGATCAWCLTSAIIMTILLWLSLAPAKAAYRILHQADPFYWN